MTDLPAVAVAQPARSAEPPIHTLSALLLVVVDNLWLLADWAALLWAITIPLSFLSVAVPVYFIQRHLRGDSRGRALAISALLGVVAAVPFSVTGSGVGIALLGYSGLRRLFGKRGSPS
jgi:hypothetical protein